MLRENEMRQQRRMYIVLSLKEQAPVCTSPSDDDIHSVCQIGSYTCSPEFGEYDLANKTVDIIFIGVFNWHLFMTLTSWEGHSD